MSKTETDIAALVVRLEKRIEKLEKSIAELKATRPVPEEDLVVIAAAAAAYMGYKGSIKAINFASPANPSGLKAVSAAH